MANKYSNYNIKVTYTNGDTEDITLKGINTSSYKEMLKVYNDVKQDHKNDSCIIDFVGVSDSGELGILFTKEIKVEEKDNNERMKNDAEDIVMEIKNLLNTLEAKKNYHCNNLNAINKKQDYILHKIEGFKNVTNNEKIKIYNELQAVRKERRLEKNEIAIVEQFDFKTIRSGLTKAKNEIGKIKYGTRFTEKTADSFDIIKEVTYRTEKERIHFMSQMKDKYDKTIVDEVNKKITFYNKGYTCNKNKKAM